MLQWIASSYQPYGCSWADAEGNQGPTSTGCNQTQLNSCLAHDHCGSNIARNNGYPELSQTNCVLQLDAQHHWKHCWWLFEDLYLHYPIKFIWSATSIHWPVQWIYTPIPDKSWDAISINGEWSCLRKVIGDAWSEATLFLPGSLHIHHHDSGWQSGGWWSSHHKYK